VVALADAQRGGSGLVVPLVAGADPAAVSTGVAPIGVLGALGALGALGVTKRHMMTTTEVAARRSGRPPPSC
jgi:hypothetical protein